MSDSGVRDLHPSGGKSTGRLCAVLLSPPVTSGVRTRNAVRRAGEVLGLREFVIVNLITVPTDDSTDVARFRPTLPELTESRSRLAEAVPASDALLFGWGLLSGFGPSRTWVREQIDWLLHMALGSGHEYAWTVGEARHPSRWHQYTSDKHSRTEGGDANARLRAVLAPRALKSFYSIREGR